VAALFISIGRMPFLVPTLDNADPHFSLLITPGFYRSAPRIKTQLMAAKPAKNNQKLQLVLHNTKWRK